MSAHNILLLGGHGKVALHLSLPPPVARVGHTGVIRNPDHVADVEKLRGEASGAEDRLTVPVRSLENVNMEVDAKGILDEVKPDYVVWSAGKFLSFSSFPPHEERRKEHKT
ncbi:hypothetical protein B0H63DRAFT_474615 [Podospora didyma]|uniref:NAD(P)-binding domain-containing protein n=1 Tax=Podospora didyma TaxID=330526 RepID=A0AAE0NG79_9PEZI|nr:hypothetical protein B0H63DRAFT_474615 [Podospora didyma]